MKPLASLLEELEQQIPVQHLLNPSISKSSVGWHIEHSLLTIDVIVSALKTSNPDEYKWSFSVLRMLILFTGKIPRGRAQSPKVVRPTGSINEEVLENHLLTARSTIGELSGLDSGNYFVHPYFGKLNLKPSVRFLQVHTNHHLNIIKDIIKAK